MVKEEIKNDRKYFMCKSCGFFYKEEKIAQKCEDFCNKHNSCNLEITKHAVQID